MKWSGVVCVWRGGGVFVLVDILGERERERAIWVAVLGG